MSLSIVDANGCQSLATEFDLIKVNKVPIADFEADITYSCSSSETINFTNNSLNGSVYLWDFDNGMTSSLDNPVIEFNNIGNYNVLLTAVSEFGCEDEMIKQVYIHPEYTIFVPTAFTPDNDGVNDVFVPVISCDAVSYQLNIFNRWGEQVFYSTDPKNAWMGDYNGNANYFVPNGIYSYNMRIKGFDKEAEYRSGNIVVMR